MYITSRVDHWKSCIGSIWRQTVILGRMRNDGFLSLIVPVPTSRVLAGQRGRCGNCGCLWCKPQFGHDLWPTFYTDKHFIKCICCDVGGEKVVVAINPTETTAISTKMLNTAGTSSIQPPAPTPTDVRETGLMSRVEFYDEVAEDRRPVSRLTCRSSCG